MFFHARHRGLRNPRREGDDPARRDLRQPDTQHHRPGGDRPRAADRPGRRDLHPCSAQPPSAVPNGCSGPYRRWCSSIVWEIGKVIARRFEQRPRGGARRDPQQYVLERRQHHGHAFMERLADRQLDELVTEGRCEFISAYAAPYTLLVIADLEGVPEADHGCSPTASPSRPRPRAQAARVPLRAVHDVHRGSPPRSRATTS